MRKYYVGDKVTIRSKEWVDKKWKEDGGRYFNALVGPFIDAMQKYCGKECTISERTQGDNGRIFYKLAEDQHTYYWDVKFFEKKKKPTYPVGTKVVPHSKTVPKFCTLEEDNNWPVGKKQGFLYVAKREKTCDTHTKKCYALSSKPGSYSGNLYFDSDFTLYKEQEAPTILKEDGIINLDVCVDLSKYDKEARVVLAEVCQRIAQDSGKVTTHLTKYNPEVSKEANAFYFRCNGTEGLTYTSGEFEEYGCKILSVYEWINHFILLKTL